MFCRACVQGTPASAPSSAVLDGLKEAHNLRRRGGLVKGSNADLEKGSKGDLEKGSKFPGLHNPPSPMTGGSGEAHDFSRSSVGAILPPKNGSKYQGPNAPSRVVGDSGEGACHDPSPAVLGLTPTPETRNLRSDSDFEEGSNFRVLHNLICKHV